MQRILEIAVFISGSIFECMITETTRPAQKPGAPQAKKGSALVAAIIAAVILSLIGGSFLKLAQHENTMALHTYESFTLLNLAEAGLEEAVWCINNKNWSGWAHVNNGNDRYMPYRKVDMDRGKKNLVRVLALNVHGIPVIYSEAKVIYKNGLSATKQLRIAYDPKGHVASGLIAKDLIVLGGEPTIDSYDSSKGPPHYAFNRNDEVTVGTVSTDVAALSLGGSVDLFGYAGTGQENPDISGSGITILGSDSPAGVTIDWDHVSTDFTYDFEPIDEPDWSGALTSLSLTNNMPNPIGDPSGSVVQYDINSLKLVGSTSIVVQGPVQINLDQGLSIAGDASIVIAPGGSIEFYSAGDMDFAGGGIVNETNQPINMQIYGTATTEGGQDINLTGDSLTQAVVYAPNAEVYLGGDGGLAGSVVAYQIKQSGYGDFHYDETLADADDDSSGITSWYELNEAQYRINFKEYLTSVNYDTTTTTDTTTTL